MEGPGQDPVLFFPLRKMIRNKGTHLDFWICREPGESFLSTGKGSLKKRETHRVFFAHSGNTFKSYVSNAIFSHFVKTKKCLTFLGSRNTIFKSEKLHTFFFEGFPEGTQTQRQANKCQSSHNKILQLPAGCWPSD